MTEDRLKDLVKLIGRMQATLDIADYVLDNEYDHSDARQRARHSIANRQAEVAELFAPRGKRR